MTILKFTRDHEWLRTDDKDKITIGITDYAQDQLGDIVYVEFPEVQTTFVAGDTMVVIESVKAVGEIKIPVAGTIHTINEQLVDSPEIVNTDAMGAGWLIEIISADSNALDDLMDEDEYKTFLSTI